ncbi:MAG: hypothetical protein H6728_01285 [Myxococcales bacterium]|nr:hypothetical protein [Myxococcales bacterium]
MPKMILFSSLLFLLFPSPSQAEQKPFDAFAGVFPIQAENNALLSLHCVGEKEKTKHPQKQPHQKSEREQEIEKIRAENTRGALLLTLPPALSLATAAGNFAVWGLSSAAEMRQGWAIAGLIVGGIVGAWGLSALSFMLTLGGSKIQGLFSIGKNDWQQLLSFGLWLLAAALSIVPSVINLVHVINTTTPVQSSLQASPSVSMSLFGGTF